MLPSEAPAADGIRIADFIIGNGSAVVGCQQIAPTAVTVSVFVPVSEETAEIVAIT